MKRRDGKAESFEAFPVSFPLDHMLLEWHEQYITLSSGILV